MKRQGIEGFTFDSKAEEWAAWRISKAMMIGSITRKMNRQIASAAKGGPVPAWLQMASDEGLNAHWQDKASLAQHCLEARHSPAQQQNAPAPYSPPTLRKAPSYGAVIGLCVVVLVAVAFWFWA